MRLRLKILSILFLVGLLPLALMAGFTLTRVEQTVRSTTHQALLSLGAEVGKEVRRTVLEGYNSIRLLAESPLLASAETPRNELEDVLTRTQRFHPVIKDITLLDLDGQVRASVFHSFRGTWESTSWFVQASQGHSVLSEVHAVLYPYDVVMTAAMPVQDELLETLPYAPVRRAVTEHSLPGSITVDFGGRRLLAVHHPLEAPGPGPAGSVRTGWHVVLVQPAEEAYAPLGELRQGLVVTVLGALAAVLLLGTLLSRPLTRRLHELVGATRRLGQGDFSTRLPDLGRDELGELGRSVNWAGSELQGSRQRLQRYQEELEALVERRTAELKRANVGLRQEIMERRLAEDRLAQLNRGLEDRVEERTRDLAAQARELERANVRLRELDELKSAFLSSVSHELRTPLTSVLGFAKMIHRDFSRVFWPLGRDHDEHEQMGRRILDNIEIIQKEGERLTRLINELLDLTKIESGRVEWNDREFNPDEAASQALRAVHGIFAQKRELALRYEPGRNLPRLRMDPDRLVQVLINLLNNAAKFTVRGEVVLSTAANGDGVELRVRDTGAGIPEDELSKVFDKFHQVHRPETLPEGMREKPQGTGLGLSICRQIVEHYGGAISVESELGRGSAFTVWLPVAQSET